METCSESEITGWEICELSRHKSPTSRIIDLRAGSVAGIFIVPGAHRKMKVFRVLETSPRRTRFGLNNNGVPTTSRFVSEMSMAGIEQAPDLGADPVEGLEGIVGPGSVDGSGRGEKSEVAVDLFGGCVGDPPQVRPVTTGTAVALGEIGRNRGRRRRSPFAVADRRRCSLPLLRYSPNGTFASSTSGL